MYGYSTSFDEPSIKWVCCSILYNIGMKATGFQKIIVIRYWTNYELSAACYAVRSVNPCISHETLKMVYYTDFILLGTVV